MFCSWLLPNFPAAFFPRPASVLSKAEICVRNHVQPYIPSILEALMVPTSQGFAEVREVFFKEVTDMNMNIVNEGGMEKLGEVRLLARRAWWRKHGRGWRVLLSGLD